MALTNQFTARRVRVEQVMGTAVSVDLRDPSVDEAALESFFAWLRSVDAAFSTYREDSTVSRIRRDELSVADAGADFAEVMDLCEQVRQASGGAFDAWRHDAAGLDPSGLVKGWSIERGAHILEIAGAWNFCINAGGDVLTRGSGSPGSGWRVGIRHPEVGDRVAAVVTVSDSAVATSAEYERGIHMRAPGGTALSGLLSVSITGPSLAFADAYATAAFVMGAAGIEWISRLEGGYEGLVMTAAGRAIWTDGFDRLRVA